MSSITINNFYGSAIPPTTTPLVDGKSEQNSTNTQPFSVQTNTSPFTQQPKQDGIQTGEQINAIDQAKTNGMSGSNSEGAAGNDPAAVINDLKSKITQLGEAQSHEQAIGLLTAMKQDFTQLVELLHSTSSAQQPPTGHEPPVGEQAGQVPAAEDQGQASSAKRQDQAPSAGQQSQAPSTEQQGQAPSAGQQGQAPSAQQQGQAPSAGQESEASSTRNGTEQKLPAKGADLSQAIQTLLSDLDNITKNLSNPDGSLRQFTADFGQLLQALAPLLNAKER